MPANRLISTPVLDERSVPALAKECSDKLCNSSRFLRIVLAVRCRSVRVILSVLLLCCIQTFVLPARADTEQDHVLSETRQRVESLDYRVSGKLARIDGQGHRSTGSFSVKAHWFADGLRMLVEATDIGGYRSQVLIHISANGYVAIDLLSPGSKTAAALPFERWSEGLSGTDFSYEDLLENQFFWKGQTYLPPGVYHSHKCFVVNSTADASDRSHYSSVTSWIDRDMIYPVHVIKTLRTSGLQKEFNYFGFRKSSSGWSSTRIEVRTQGGTGSSQFVIERGSDKAKLTLKDFELGPSVTKRDQ
jgi:hypothetical protein